MEEDKKGKQLKSLPVTFIKPPHGAYKTGMAQSKKKRCKTAIKCVILTFRLQTC